MGLFHECCGLNPGAPANQSRLPLRIAGGRTNRAVPRHSWGPVSVSIHGYRLLSPGPVFDSRFLHLRRGGERLQRSPCGGRNCNTAGVWLELQD
jgi:hypothetical protein